MKKALKWTGAAILTGLFALIGYVYSLTLTPFGKLDYRQALFLKFIINAHPGPPPGFAANGTFLPLEQRRKQPFVITEFTPFKNIHKLKIGPDSIPIQIYIPETGLSQKLPVLIDYHGGAWTKPLSSLEEESYRQFANLTRFIIIGVDYRVAPEHPFPAAVNDCYETFKWVLSNIPEYQGDTSRIALMGESAGANLAAVVAYKAKKDGIGHIIKHLTLFCPPTDLRPTAHYQSRIDFADGFMLPGKDIPSISRTYVPNRSDTFSPEASIITADDLGDMPPTFLITAQFDPLRDEGKVFADKLKKAGVPVRYKCVSGFIHCMIGTWIENDIQKMNVEMSEEIRKAFRI